VRKVIFLDIDGVLCTTKAHLAYSTQLLMRHYDPVSTRLLARLCRETGAELVLSSTWRISFDLCHMNALLMNAGFDDVPWHQAWRTPKMYDESRGHEIEAWLDNHGKVTPPRYCILDDDSDMLAHQLPFFVQTDTHEGFGYKEYEKAGKILQEAQ
jgi:hypothetical protein